MGTVISSYFDVPNFITLLLSHRHIDVYEVQQWRS